jgi:hypothetical protein
MPADQIGERVMMRLVPNAADVDELRGADRTSQCASEDNPARSARESDKARGSS